MTKRVLRDRSTLRPPPDEPPIKRPHPPPKKIIKEPFTFEDLPPELYNSVLEKMLLKDFKQFNFGSKFSARICEEFEMKDGPLDLEELPVDLYSTIVEKLPFKDFTIFNLGSKLTKEMCGSLREIEAPVEKIFLNGMVKAFAAAREEKFLHVVPEKVRLRTKQLQIHTMDLTPIVKHKIRANQVKFHGDACDDQDFVKEVLMLTRPQELFFQSTSLETLKLEEMKNVNKVVFIPWSGFDDGDLLAMGFESFTVGLRPWHTPAITMQGILRLLQEWKAGTRRIKEIKIMFSGLDRKMIRREFPRHPQSTTGRTIICKEDGESDCVVFEEYRTVIISEQKCRRARKRSIANFPPNPPL